MTYLKNKKVKVDNTECSISTELKDIAASLMYSRQKNHIVKQLNEILVLLIESKKISLDIVNKKIGHMTNTTFLKYINIFKKLRLCIRKRDIETNEIYYHFTNNKTFKLTLFLLRNDFRCPMLATRECRSFLRQYKVKNKASQ